MPRPGIVLTAPEDNIPLLFVEVDNCHETAEELADTLEKYARPFRRKVKVTAGKTQPMWRTRWTTPPGSGPDDPYPSVLLVFIGQFRVPGDEVRLAYLFPGEDDRVMGMHPTSGEAPRALTA